jgi:hypothetical protein
MVKAISLLTLALSIAVSQAKAQNAANQDSTNTDGAQRLERFEFVLGSCLAFSLADYAGYNIFVKGDQSRTGAIFGLHVFDAAFGGAINYFLYKTCGLSTAISFDLVWWTWGLDLGFSGWGDVINPATPWVNRTNSSLHSNSITWAGWTPIGLLRQQGTVIDKYALYAQAIVGFSISMPILW